MSGCPPVAVTAAAAGIMRQMVSGWVQPQGEFVEIEVEARPVRSTRSPRPEGVGPPIQARLE